MSKLKIHHLFEGGMSKCAIAATLGCSVRTVYSTLKEPPPTPEEIAAGVEDRPIRPGRPSVVALVRPQILSWLQAEPSIRCSEIIRRLRSEGYRNSARAVYDLVTQIRPEPIATSPEVVVEGLPGEFAQFDFGQCRIRFRYGTVSKVRFFEGVLKYSRHRHVVIVPDERAETLVRSVISCIGVWGGAPKQWVFDNPTTVWENRIRQQPHAYLRQLLAECNALIESTVPRRPNQKGTIENGIGFAKHGYFLAREHTNWEEMERELPIWLKYVNEERVHSATKIIPMERLAHERERLADRSLTWDANSWPLTETCTVLPTGLVRWAGAAYSVDPRKLGAPATLSIRAHTIDIAIGNSRCTHPRLDHTGEISRLPEHSMAQIAITTEARKQTYAKRQHLFDLGPTAVSFCDKLIMGHPGNGWYADIHRLYDVSVSHGQGRFLTALAECLSRREYTVESVVSILSRRGVAQ